MALNAISPEDFSSSVMSIKVSLEDGLVLAPNFESSDVLINNCLPPEYSFDAKYIVGFTYWETTRLPTKWVNYMNRCDELWTTSAWAKQVFIDSGVTKPVYSFDLGFNTDAFYYADRKKHLYDPFTFIHIGSPSTRKNTQLVFDAFYKLFSYRSDYKLIIKSNGPPDARLIVGGENLGSINQVKNVEVIDYYLDDNKLGDLLRQSNCMIYPTRGEGWGMAPFQAIATGLPTICTNATACTEFADLSVPLEANYSMTNQFGIYQTGQWAEPNIDDVCDRILYVVNNYDSVLEKTRAGSEVLHRDYSWDKVVIKYKDRISEIKECLK